MPACPPAPPSFRTVAYNLLDLYTDAERRGGSVDFDALDWIVEQARAAVLADSVDAAGHLPVAYNRDTEGEALADALRAEAIGARHYGEGHIEIGGMFGHVYAYVDVQDDGTADVAYYDEAHGYPDAVGQTTHDARDVAAIVAAIATHHDRAAGGAR